MGTFGLIEGDVGRFIDLSLRGFVAELDLQYRPVGQNHRALDHIAKFANIAWPEVGHMAPMELAAIFSIGLPIELLNSLTKVHAKNGMS